MTVPALLLDLDGVLVECQEWHDRALERAMHAANFPDFRAAPGRSVDQIEAHTRDSMETARIYARKWKQLEAIARDHMSQWPANSETAKAVSAIADRADRIAIVTDTLFDAAWLEFMACAGQTIESVGPAWWLIARENSYMPGKPDPTLHRRALARLRARPQDCVALEDAERGLEAARLAGVERVVEVHGPRALRRWVEENL